MRWTPVPTTSRLVTRSVTTPRRDVLPEPRDAAQAGLAEATRLHALGLLRQRLAACIDLQTLIRQAKQYPNASSSIEFRRGLNEIEAEVADYAGLLAERAVQLGWGGDEAFDVAEKEPAPSPGADQGARLRKAIVAFTRGVRGGIDETDLLGDAESAGLLAEISRMADTWLWWFEVPRQVGVAEARSPGG